jgi:uncharacterized protein (TIGR02646 family)
MQPMRRVGPPSCLLQNASSWTADWVQGTARTWTWRSVACKSAIDSALLESTADRCSYCASEPITPEVDHFFPKESFRSLAFEWSNLYITCTGCNRVKSDKTPGEGVLRPDDAGFAFETFFVANPDGSLSENPAADNETQARARSTLALFRLNRTDLVRYRRKAANGSLLAFAPLPEDLRRS